VEDGGFLRVKREVVKVLNDLYCIKFIDF